MNLLKRLLAALLCAAVLLCAAPICRADLTDPGFSTIEEAGRLHNLAAVCERTEPKFYAAWIGQFVGGYAPYVDISTGLHGIVNADGAVAWKSQDPQVQDIMLYPNGFASVWIENQGRFLYNVRGKKLLEEPISFQVQCRTDEATGEAVCLQCTPDSAFGQSFDLVDANGRRMTAQAFGPIYNGKLTCCENGKWGLRALFGNTLLPFRYDFLCFLSADCLLARENGSCALVDLQGNQLRSLGALEELDEASLLWDGVKQVLARKNGKWGVLDRMGDVVIPFVYDTLTGGDHYEGVRDGMRYFLGSGTPGIQIPMCEEDSGEEAVVFDLGNGVYVKRLFQEDTYTVVNQTGELLLPDAFRYYYDEFSDTGLLCFEKQTTEGGVCKTWICVYDAALRKRAELLCGDYWSLTWNRIIITGGGKTCIYSVDGALLKTVNAEAALIDSGFILFKRAGQYAMADADGTLLTDYSFSDHWESLGTGLITLKQDSGWYLMNARAERVLPYPLDEAILFYGSDTSNDLFSYKSGGRYGFLQLRKPQESPFPDVKEQAWYLQAVKFCYNAGLMSGTGNGQFSPKTTTTRAMLVTMLYKLSGEKTASHGFTDVPDGKWYSDAVNWAAASGIVGGKTPTTFCPNDPVTREQLVTILNKYAGCFAPQSADLSVLTPYQDADRISAYAREAMAWAVGNGFVSGKTATTLDPKGKATRAEIALIIMHFIQFMAA